MSNRSSGDPDHGIEIVVDAGVSLVDKNSGAVVRFSREEFDAFRRGVLAGEFDLDQLAAHGEDAAGR